MAVGSYQPQFTQGDINRLVMQKAERMRKAVLSRLSRIGEAFVTDARSINTYQDQTGNLRSSIGYVILENGVQVEGSDFEVVKDGAEGAARGKELIDELTAKYSTGYVLIVVAGMEYAAAVEDNGYDVLTMSSIQAETALKTAMQKLGAKA